MHAVYKTRKNWLGTLDQKVGPAELWMDNEVSRPATGHSRENGLPTEFAQPKHSVTAKMLTAIQDWYEDLGDERTAAGILTAGSVVKAWPLVANELRAG